MAYVSLGNLVLKTNYTTRELDLISFNATNAMVQAYINQLRENITVVREEVADAQATANEALALNQIEFGTDEPTDPNVEYWGIITPRQD